QALRRLDDRLYVEIPEVARAQHRHAFASEPELLARLSALRNLDLRLSPVERRNGDLAAERRLDDGDRHAAEEVGAVALEEQVRLDRKEDVEVARRAPAQTRFAFARQTNAR